MKSDSLNMTVGKAFIRLLILSLVWSVFFGLYQISEYGNPGLVGVIFFLLGIYTVLEVFLVVAEYILGRIQKSKNHYVHDVAKRKLHESQKSI